MLLLLLFAGFIVNYVWRHQLDPDDVCGSRDDDDNDDVFIVFACF